MMHACSCCLASEHALLLLCRAWHGPLLQLLLVLCGAWLRACLAHVLRCVCFLSHLCAGMCVATYVLACVCCWFACTVASVERVRSAGGVFQQGCGAWGVEWMQSLHSVSFARACWHTRCEERYTCTAHAVAPRACTQQRVLSCSGSWP
jgi:hypothetical protein